MLSVRLRMNPSVCLRFELHAETTRLSFPRHLLHLSRLVSIQGVDGSCGGCRKVRDRCGICGEEIVKGSCRGGIAAKRLEEVFVAVAFVVKAWTYIVVGIFRRSVEWLG